MLPTPRDWATQLEAKRRAKAAARQQARAEAEAATAAAASVAAAEAAEAQRKRERNRREVACLDRQVGEKQRRAVVAKLADTEVQHLAWRVMLYIMHRCWIAAVQP